MENNFTHEIVLPSLGLLNPNIPGGKIVQRCMRVQDQKYLSGSSSSDNGINKLLQDTIVSPEGIKVSELSLPDTMFLIMSLRSISYGDTIKYDYRCPHCREVSKYSVDISKLEIYDLSTDYESDLRVELPHAGDTVYTRFLKNRDMEEIRDEVKRIRDMSDNPDATDGLDYILRLAKMIKKIELVKENADRDKILTDPVDIRKYVDQMTNYDATAVLATVDSVEFGISPDYETTCPVCKKSFRAPVLMDSTFFRPKFEIKHKRSRRK